ncbi:hypothetical protein JDS79_15495 [Bacillus cereus]|nr:hypothetical protein [Bacillus cereus]MBJ8071127.1 hypothetical protein [Bacillus cereus]MBJ8188362.1 hypothetical protein [Bacillus cereus]
MEDADVEIVTIAVVNVNIIVIAMNVVAIVNVMMMTINVVSGNFFERVLRSKYSFFV